MTVADGWRSELEEARVRAQRRAGELEEAVDLAVRWWVTDDALTWWIELGAALEPDVDLEEVGGAIVVRVRRSGAPPIARAVLAAPPGRPVATLAVDFHDGGLEVRFVFVGT